MAEPNATRITPRTGIPIVHTAVRAPNMNALCEHFWARCIASASTTFSCSTARTFDRVVTGYVGYHNAARPHQGIRQLTLVPAERPAEGNIVALPVLGGLR